MDINALRRRLQGLLNSGGQAVSQAVNTVNPYGDTNRQQAGNQNFWTQQAAPITRNVIKSVGNSPITNFAPNLGMMKFNNAPTVSQFAKPIVNNLATTVKEGVPAILRSNPLVSDVRTINQILNKQPIRPPSFQEQTSDLMKAGKLGAMAYGIPKMTLGSIAGSMGLSGGLNKLMGGSFTEGAAQGLAIAPTLSGIGRLTNPLINKAAMSLAGKTANPVMKLMTNRAATGALNIPEGVIMKGALTNNPYGLADAGLDFATGAVMGSRPKAMVSKGMVMKKSYKDVVPENEDLIKDVIVRYEKMAGEAYDPQKPVVDLDLDRHARELWKDLHGINKRAPENLGQVVGEIRENYNGWKTEMEMGQQGIRMGIKGDNGGNGGQSQATGGVGVGVEAGLGNSTPSSLASKFLSEIKQGHKVTVGGELLTNFYHNGNSVGLYKSKSDLISKLDIERTAKIHNELKTGDFVPKQEVKTMNQLVKEFPELDTFEGSLATSRKLSSISQELKVGDIYPKKVGGFLVEVKYNGVTGQGYGINGAIDNLQMEIASKKNGYIPKTKQELSQLEKDRTIGTGLRYSEKTYVPTGGVGSVNTDQITKQVLQKNMPQGLEGQKLEQPQVSPLMGSQADTVTPLLTSSNKSVTQDIRKVLNGEELKERQFITTVKNSSKTPEPLRAIVEGTYIVKSNDQLQKDAISLIKSNPELAEQVALKPTSDVHVAIGNELVKYYGAVGNFTKAKQIAEGMAEGGTDFGRAVQAYALYDKISPAGALKFAQTKVREYNKTHPNAKLSLEDSQVKSLFDRATKIQSMPEGRPRNIAANELMNEVHGLIPSSIVDKGIAVWKAGLLTSLRTTERNVLGNSIHAGFETMKDMPASMADRMMSLRTGKRSMTFTTKGSATGTKEGIGKARDMITMGYDPEESITKYDLRHITWGKNPVEQVLKKYTDIVFRSLGAQDKPFYSAAFARSLHDQAGAAAINAGKQGDSNFIKNLVKEPTEDMLKIATKDASKATFHDENGFSSLANTVKQQLSKNELTKLGGEILMPFTGVPSSIAGQMLAYSPLGLVKGIANAGKVVVKDLPDLQRQAAQEIGRGAMGTGLIGLGAYLTANGLMTGQPKDADEAAQWQIENKQANSVLIGGQWRSINSIGPEALLVLAGAKAQEEMGKGEEASIGAYGARLGKDFLGQTFLQGVQQPLAAINDPVRYGKSYIGNQSASVVPNIIKDTSKAFDGNQRENNTITDYLTNAIPFLRNQNIVKRDNLGNPIPQEPTGLGAYFDLFNSKTPNTSPVIDELSRLSGIGTSATPSKLQKKQTINGEKMSLTPQQLDTLESQVGPQATQAIQQLIQSPDYQALPDEDKAKAIDSVVTSVRKQVRGGIDLNGGQSMNLPTGSGQYTLINESGTVKRIDLNSPITKPQLTNNYELDKKLMSKYGGELTSRANDITALFQAGKITAEVAEKSLQDLKSKKEVGKVKKGRRLKISLSKIKMPKIKLMKSNMKAFKIKPIKFAKSKKPKTLNLKPIKLS